MKLINGEKGKSHLSVLNSDALKDCNEVWAAIAYVTDDSQLIKPCYEKQIPLKLWARYDYSVPVKIDILKWFLGKTTEGYICKLVPDILHSKIIWWRPYGVYIGSANLTDRAWFGNFESGVFFTEFELEDQNLKTDLEKYFESIDLASQELTEEIVKEQQMQQGNMNNNSQEEMLRKEFNQNRKIPELKGVSDVTKEQNYIKKKKQKFLKEWNNTLQYLRDIGTVVSRKENQPSWLPDETPVGVQVDQFLHAYYYKFVIQGNKSHHNECHQKNKLRMKKALEKTISWWKNLPSPPSEEDKNIASAPIIAERFSKEKILTLSQDEFSEVIVKIHAFKTYARQISHKTLGFSSKLQKMEIEERGELVSKKLYENINLEGENILQVIHYLLYGGSIEDTPDRLFEVAFDERKKISFIGLSSFGEIVGWVLSDKFPPRNNRTSKALYALGYDVNFTG